MSTLTSDGVDRYPLEKDMLSPEDDVLTSESSGPDSCSGALSAACALLVSLRSCPKDSSRTTSIALRANVPRGPRCCRRPRRRSSSQFPTITWHPCMMVVDMFVAVADADVTRDAGMSFRVLMRCAESEVWM